MSRADDDAPKPDVTDADVKASDQSVIPLIVDLDGTLCKTDTLHEAILSELSSNPKSIFPILAKSPGPKTVFKKEIATRRTVGADQVPLNEQVVKLIEEAKEDERPVLLVSASWHTQVQNFAEDTDLFDEAIGSTSDGNMKGGAKAEYLVSRFGRRGFDYVGDAAVDAAVWKEARIAYSVNAPESVRALAEAGGEKAVHLGSPPNRTKAALRAIRPHQWSKNTLLFLPAAAAHDFSNLLALLFAFIAFSLAASAVYVVNDLLDLQSDRLHPRKRHRPFASGELTAKDGGQLCLLLCGLSVLSTLIVGSWPFALTLCLYLVATFAYSLYLKRKLVVDVLALAGLYTVRVIAGAAAASVVLSPWMLAFSMFIFLALAAVKRQAELADAEADGRRLSGRAYVPEDLPILRGVALSSGHMATLVLALYITSDQVQTLYTRPEALWLVCPLLLYWVIRMVMVTHRGKMTDDPIVFSFRDRTSLTVIASCAALVGLASML